MKTKKELNELKDEVEALSKKLKGLNEDELKEVTGGIWGFPDGPWGNPPLIIEGQKSSLVDGLIKDRGKIEK